jgi:serine protease Do
LGSISFEKEQRILCIDQKNKKGLNIGDNEIVAASSGTGFFVSRQGHMITNHHVIDGCLNVKVIYNGKDYDTKTLSVDKMNDLAIIKTDARPRSVFSVSDRDASLLENVIVAGYPLGKKVSSAIKATSGTVTALAGVGDNYAEFQTDAALNSGNSGGPIINDQGNVVGVAVSKIKKEGVESFNFGVKSSILRIFAGANELKFLTPNKRDLKKKDLGELITDATVYLECWMTGRDLKILIAQENSMKAFYSNFK